MRQFLFIPCLFAVSCLLAQSKASPYAQNLNAPAPAKGLQSDCYVRKYDAATSALRRGDYRVALRLFEEAKTCPEALSSSRRIEELEARIEYCNAHLGKSIAEADAKSTATRKTASVETTGRKFNISAALAGNTDPNCFQMTVREADRAFRDSCWDDAAKLYRAAKNCADANQTDRERMSTRIESCRAAAEDELLQKEQKAVRTARHAIASNRFSMEAMALLRQGDRSLAWRLADFANFYIAPDDNPDCLEAMYGAYFYVPTAGDNKTVHPAFCYQLSQDLNGFVQFKFSRDRNGERLTAFAPQEHRLISWELPSMKVTSDDRVGQLNDPIGFDISPNGSLLFFGYNYFYLPNGQTIDLSSVSCYCFSEDGNLFFYEDVSTGAIHAVNLDKGNRVQQQMRNNAPAFGRAAVPPPPPIEVQTGLLDMQMYQGELWLGYRDRVEVFALNRSNGAMEPRITWQLADSALISDDANFTHIYPATREAIVATPKETFYFFLNLPPNDSNTVVLVAPTHKITGQFLASTAFADPLITVHATNTEGTADETISVDYPALQQLAHRFYSKTTPAPTASAAISEHGDWLACQDGLGRTQLWSLKDTGATTPIFLENSPDGRLSPDGNRLYLGYADELRVYDVDAVQAGTQLVLPRLQDARPLEGISNKWAVCQRNESKIVLHHLTTKQTFEFDAGYTIDGPPVAYAFDNAETQYFAYTPGKGLVVVKSLTNDATLDSRDFGGIVTLIRSIPGSGKLLVVSRTNNISGNRYTVRVWDFSKRGELPHVIRLQGYDVFQAVVSEQGNRVALSNGMDVRIFQLDNLDNESVVIKSVNQTLFNEIAFRPDGLALATGCDDGNVYIWDANSGQLLLRFANAWEGQKYPVYRMAFAYGGTRLRLFSPGRLSTIDLDANTLRDVVQSDHRWLTAFTPAQIRDYNLEIAFKYPGNFDRLAKSKDYPLIRAFFQYFRDQSINSNNIEQVRSYCDRAFTLFKLLDEDGQENLEPTMIEMLEDYISKCLLRNQTDEASHVVMLLENQFNRPNAAILSAAHTSLIRHDLPAASRLYSNYMLHITRDYQFDYLLEAIQAKLSQFREYDLLDSAQISCLCEVFQTYKTFGGLCPTGKKYTQSVYSKQIPIYQLVYHTIDSVAYWLNRSDKMKALEQALALAKTLDYPNPVVVEHPLEQVSIALANAYLALAAFEQNSPKTPVYYEKTVDLLEKTGPFQSALDTARLSHLVFTHLNWSRYLLADNNIADAVSHINAGLQISKKLSAHYGESSMDAVQLGAGVLASLYLELCKARLLEGKPAEARKAFETADNYAAQKLNTVMLGHAALLENDETSAFLEYGGIVTLDQLGDALTQIDRMAELLPAQRARLEAFIPRLKAAFLAIHSNFKLAEANYWQAVQQMNRYAVQNRWDSTLVWSTIATNNIEKIMAETDNPNSWRNYWINQQISQSYYLLNAKFQDTSALSEIIRYSEKALDWQKTADPYSINFTYIYTNLAHAYLLRNRPGDRQIAIQTYKDLLQSYNTQDDGWELLIKDFRDLRRTGIVWPDLKKLILEIKPEGAQLTPEDWQEMGE